MRILIYFLILFITSCTYFKNITNDKVHYNICELDGVINFFFYADTVWNAPKYWEIETTYYEENKITKSFIPVTYNNKKITKMCDGFQDLPVLNEKLNIYKLDVFANQDSMINQEKLIYYSDNIYDPGEKNLKVISLYIKGKGLELNNMCNDYLLNLNDTGNCPGPNVPFKNPLVFLQKIEHIRSLNNDEINRLGYKKDELDYIDIIFCD